ncbi:MAG: pyrimidine/purine nucleoside phosphorylase [Planctomycetes bacterium]|nr:pyrimidine/purine nucleoside phosphorylase [Planctomycetota bacterium]
MFKTNEYFDGKVKSIAFRTADGDATVGVMDVGAYEFGTSTVELMTVTSGKLTVMLPDSDTWEEFTAGQTFTVQANTKFKVKAEGQTSYLCQYRL